MSHRVSIVLLLLSLFWIDAADAQRAPRDSPSRSLSVYEGRLTAHINRIPLRVVLEELARQVPLRLSVSGEWGDHPVTAHFRGLPLDEALARLLAGFSYALTYAPASYGAGSAATKQIGELMVFAAATATKDSRSREAADLARTPGTAPPQRPDQAQAAVLLDTPPEWAAVLQHADKEVRLEALQHWAGQGAATPLDPLTHALVDPDESVRARAGELVERVWAAQAAAR